MSTNQKHYLSYHHKYFSRAMFSLTLTPNMRIIQWIARESDRSSASHVLFSSTEITNTIQHYNIIYAYLFISCPYSVCFVGFLGSDRRIRWLRWKIQCFSGISSVWRQNTDTEAQVRRFPTLILSLKISHKANQLVNMYIASNYFS